jgi:uncharacterized protein (TIGR00661 family)
MLTGPKKRVLVTPLDWGLGHATRCVPIIRELLRQRVEVFLAADGKPYSFFEKEFPKLPLIRFPGYKITYPKHSLLGLHLLLQSPRIANRIRIERKTIKKIVADNGIDVIISDNRFGARTDKTLNIFVTHQLKVKSPFGEKITTALHRAYYERFDQVWVPDAEGKINLSGELSHGVDTEKPVRYIGPLTRFEQSDILNLREKKWWLVVLLSGPEPQRGIFEKIILSEAAKFMEDILIIRGVIDGEKNVSHPFPHVTMVNHLPDDEMKEELLSSHYVLCRPGYSTLCDLSALHISPIVVPTPGQTEQEYLAAYHAEENKVVNVSQKKFNLGKAVRSYHKMNELGVFSDEWALEKRVRSLLGL